MIDELANELMIASQIMHTNNVTAIANEIGYKPILIFNALYRGAETGKFVYNKKTDTITISEDVEIESLAVSEGITELIEQIEMLTTYLNAEEKDMSIEEMQMLLGGTPALHVRMAALTSKKLATYQIRDPKDKKSSYTYITLVENLAKEYGHKQFNVKTSKATKLAAKNAK